MIPLGYKLIDNGSKNHKGKHILDFVICEEEAKIVEKIFSLSMDMNYGQSRIAKYLNEHMYKSKTGGVFHASSIQTILNNSIYKGQFRFNSKVRDKVVYSPIREDLIIIPEHIWQKNQEIMKNRVYKKEDYQRTDNRTTKNIYGKMLLNGLAFCGYCGQALTTMTAYTTWETKDKVKHKNTYYKYRCASFYKRGGLKCEGKSTYGTSIIEPIVIEETKKIIIQLEGKKLNEEFINSLKQKEKNMIKGKNDVIQRIEEGYKKVKAYKEELSNILLGTSSLDKNIVNDLIITTEKEIVSLTEQLKDIEKRILLFKEEKESYTAMNLDFSDWGRRFDDADLETKRIMLSKVLDNILVYKDEIVINFSVKIETYKANLTDNTSCTMKQKR